MDPMAVDLSEQERQAILCEPREEVYDPSRPLASLSRCQREFVIHLATTGDSVSKAVQKAIVGRASVYGKTGWGIENVRQWRHDFLATFAARNSDLRTVHRAVSSLVPQSIAVIRHVLFEGTSSAEATDVGKVTKMRLDTAKWIVDKQVMLTKSLPDESPLGEEGEERMNAMLTVLRGGRE
jgi:hypothetical protein